jgi:HAD superfamily hydrolase (TIGR01450 family)
MAWVLDLDGVIWLAERAIAGAADAVARLWAAGEEVAFVTNNSAVPRADVEAKLRRFSIDPRDGVVTSAMAASALIQPGERVLVCAGPGARQEAEARGATVVRDGDADVVLVGFHRDFDYERMRAASVAVMRGARLVATNDDATYPTPDGPIPGGGAILASIVRATGADPIVAGKPYAPMVDLVRERVGPEGIAVGDRPDTDGRFAVALGFRFGLVLSGVTSAADLPVEPKPSLVASDLATLVDQELAAGDARAAR